MSTSPNGKLQGTVNHVAREITIIIPELLVVVTSALVVVVKSVQFIGGRIRPSVAEQRE